MRTGRTLLPFVLLAASVAGCRMFRPVNPNAPSPESTTEMATPSADTATAAAPVMVAVEPDPRARDVGSVNDRTISAMLLAFNNADIFYARLVPGRSQREDVKAFAQRMLTDHAGINALVTELLAKTDMTPEENNASVDLRDETAIQRNMLRDLSGFAFDSAFMTNEISYHRRFLELIDNVMVPRARRDELKGLLATARPAVAAHLAHAEQVWTNVMTKK
jgi:putative membrane protein